MCVSIFTCLQVNASMVTTDVIAIFYRVEQQATDGQQSSATER